MDVETGSEMCVNIDFVICHLELVYIVFWCLLKLVEDNVLLSLVNSSLYPVESLVFKWNVTCEQMSFVHPSERWRT